MSRGSIEIKNVNKVFATLNTGESFTAIENASLDIKPGEFVSIIGKSGCGKSTLLRMIAGLEFPTQGEVLADGAPIKGPSVDRGLVFQEHTLFPWLTVRKNLIFALKNAKKYEQYKDQIEPLLKTSGLSEFADSYPHQLSGGMRQRAAVIRSLIVSPDILLMDEPLGALDNFTRMTLQDELIRLWQERNNTMVLITHDIDEAIYLSQKVIVMSPRPGKITEIVDIPMSYPRNRSSGDFADLRGKLLKLLDYAHEVVEDYNI